MLTCVSRMWAVHCLYTEHHHSEAPALLYLLLCFPAGLCGIMLHMLVGLMPCEERCYSMQKHAVCTGPV